MHVIRRLDSRRWYWVRFQGEVMAFVNEWVSREDIEKYGLVDLCMKYQGDEWKYIGVQDPNRKIDWTIDREREIWLINIAAVTNQEYDFPSATEGKTFLFYYKGEAYEVKMESVGISTDRNVYPFNVGWKYLGMDLEGLDSTEGQSIKRILYEALKVFGQFGMSRKRNPNLEIVCIDFEGDLEE